MNRLTVTKASVDTVQRVVPLFDAYRQHYGAPADPDVARNFPLTQESILAH